MRHAAARAAVRVRGRHLLVLDLVAIVVAAYLALAIRYDRLFAALPSLPTLQVVAILLVGRTLINIRGGLYGRRWRFASVPDLQRIVVAVGLGSFVAATVFYAAATIVDPSWSARLPRSFWFCELLLSLAFIGSFRLAIRIAADMGDRPVADPFRVRRPALLYGAGHAGVLVARSAQREPGAGILPVGFLDDDPAVAGSYVAGLPVFGGIDALEGAVSTTGAESLLITMPSAPGRAIRRVVAAAMGIGLDVRALPSINDLTDGSVDAYRIRSVNVQDLLRRPIVTEHAVGVREIIEGGVVMITGAGGSIGSELARQAHSIRPRRMILVDRAESPLYAVQRELETRRVDGKAPEIVVQLANVMNRPAMARLLGTEQPDVIFHAAAYKHVPMLEAHPSDAIRVNVGGTASIVDAAIEAGVQHVVLVSTDKAVQPTSVMGASKRMAEFVVADAARRTGWPYVSVRFGNVLGSAGSVIPLFQDQLERGERLTITHPDMTRFFMTIPEAAWLILDAAALGETGDLFVLDMGEPVRIMDLARDFVRLAGRDPDSHPFEIIGLRPGEKLHEELFYPAEQVSPTSSAKVLRVSAPPPPPDIRGEVTRLLALATGEDEPALRTAMLQYANAPAAPDAAAEPTFDLMRFDVRVPAAATV
jgi:FlaA1/EpsC-like NDP-sugar epimerase